LKNILYVEEPIEVKSAISYGVDLNDTVFIALTIKAQAFLKRNNINFNNTLKYFDNNSHVDCLKYSNSLVESIEQVFQQTNIKYNAIYDWLSNSIRLSATNYLIFLIEVISKSFIKHKPELLIIPKYKSSLLSGWSTKQNDYFHGELAKLIASNQNINIIEFEIDDYISLDLNE